MELSTATLAQIAQDIRSRDNNVRMDLWAIAEGLAFAKDLCEEQDKSWGEWLTEDVGYSLPQANEYVKVYKSLAASGSRLVENGSSFNELKLLAKPNLPEGVRTRLVKKQLTSNRLPMSELKEKVAAALPPRVALQPPATPVFADRLATALKRKVSGFYLFDLAPTSNRETREIIVRYWSQKYHPDKTGGDSAAFNMITELKGELL